MFKKRKITIAVMFTVLCIGTSDAQTVMTLHDCMRYAVENSTKMKIQNTEISDFRADRRRTMAEAFTPSVNANTYASFNFGRAVDPETNTYKSIQTFNNGYSVNAQITIFDGFRALNNIRIARTALKMGISREQQLKDEICLSVMQAYYNVVYSSRMVQVCREMVMTAEENVRLVRRLEELGEKSHADVVHFEAELAGRNYDLTEITSLHDNALLELKNIMLWQNGDELEIDMSVAENTDVSDVDYGAAALVDRAVSTLPSVTIARQKMDNARRDKHNAFASMLPTLSFGMGWNTSYYTYQGITTAPFTRQFKDNSGEYLQFNLSIPLFNGLSGHTRYIKAKNAQRRAAAEYEQTLHDVENEVMCALQERSQARASFLQADRMMHSQEEAYHLDKSKMQKGLISPVEFRASADEYMKARAKRTDALLKYYLKRSVVEYYNGTSYLEQIN